MTRQSSKSQGRSAVGQRPLRVGEAVRHALAEILARGELRDPALRGRSITVSEVRVSPDLRHAIAFVMPLGGDDVAPVIAALRRAAPYLRGQIARVVRLRTAIDIAFAADASFEYASRIEAALRRPEVQRDVATPEDPASDPEPR
jgi:ribosome-binding factor A